MKRIATDTYNSEGLITKGYIYVDKAVVLCPLVSHNFGEHIFLSRPHRSGDFIGEERVEEMEGEGTREKVRGRRCEEW